VQVPQSIVPPHPSPIGPQFAPIEAHVIAVHPPPSENGLPQTFGFVAPQISDVETQLPHSTMPPQPSATGPQLAP
jgi:hypothetical protein